MLNEGIDLSQLERCCNYSIDIEIDPTKQIKYVEFDYTCPICFDSIAWLLVDKECSDPRNLTECPCRWRLNRKAKKIKLKSNVCLRKCVYIEVVYEEPPVEWIQIAPGASYPLPLEPIEITHVVCQARTDTGMNSVLGIGNSLLFPDYFQVITEIPNPVQYTFPSPVLASEKKLFNIGDAIVYIRSLMTE